MFRRPQIMIFPLLSNIKIQIHTCFVLGTINVFFLDENKRIVEKVRDLKPFKFYSATNKCKWMVETPTDVEFKVGDVLKF